MPDDVVLNKVAVIERCLGRIREEYEGHESELATHFTKQDSIILNAQMGPRPQRPHVSVACLFVQGRLIRSP